MDIAFPILLLILGFIFFILGIYEEREIKNTNEEQSRSDHIVIICLIIAFLLFFIGGICFMGITTTYFSVADQEFIEVAQTIYRPFVWLGVGLAFVDVLLLVEKIFEILTEQIKY